MLKTDSRNNNVTESATHLFWHQRGEETIEKVEQAEGEIGIDRRNDLFHILPHEFNRRLKQDARVTPTEILGGLMQCHDTIIRSFIILVVLRRSV